MLQRSKDEFIQAVLDEVRYSFSHYQIKEELLDHIDESVESLVEEGVDESQALDIAIERMGDAHEIGKDLNEVHSPFWGWLNGITKFVGVVVVVLVLFQVVIPYGKTLYNRLDFSKEYLSVPSSIQFAYRGHYQIERQIAISYSSKESEVKNSFNMIYVLNDDTVLIEFKRSLRNPLLLFKQLTLNQFFQVQVNHDPTTKDEWFYPNVVNSTSLSQHGYIMIPNASLCESVQIILEQETLDINLKEILYEQKE